MEYKSKGYTVFTVFNYIILTFIGLVCLYPLYYVVIASFSAPVKLISHDGLLLLPLKNYTLDGYRMVFQNKLVMSGYKNTLIVLVAGVCINMLLTILGAYVISQRQLMLRKPLTIFIIITMYFSGGMIPAYLNVRDLGMMDTLLALIMPNAINTSNLLIMRSFYVCTGKSFRGGRNRWGEPQTDSFSGYGASGKGNHGGAGSLLRRSALEFLVQRIYLPAFQR